MCVCVCPTIESIWMYMYYNIHFYIVDFNFKVSIEI